MGGSAHIAEKAYDAFKNGDIPTVIGLLTDDVRWRTPMTLPNGKAVNPGLVHVFGIRDGKISSFGEYTDLDGALV